MSWILLGIVHFAILLGPTAGTYGPQYDLSLDDWMTHPDIKAVREIYDEIKTGIKDKTYRSEQRQFDVESASCSTYPMKSETLVFDAAKRVRLYKIVQIGSHREPFTVERYYDTKGTLRFVFVEYLFSNERIYLNSTGNIFWAVAYSNKKFTVLDSKKDDWEMKPNNANEAREEFQAEQSCQEIAK